MVNTINKNKSVLPSPLLPYHHHRNHQTEALTLPVVLSSWLHQIPLSTYKHHCRTANLHIVCFLCIEGTEVARLFPLLYSQYNQQNDSLPTQWHSPPSLKSTSLLFVKSIPR